MKLLKCFIISVVIDIHVKYFEQIDFIENCIVAWLYLTGHEPNKKTDL
jgi:hypothetical protein